MDHSNSSKICVSVVVCVHNGERDLPHLFAALRRQSLPRDEWEVIVVDDASTDSTVALSRAEPGVRVVEAREHIGLPAARNRGISEVKGKYIAMTDADTQPAVDWLATGVRRLDSGGVDLLAGGITVPLGENPSVAALLDASEHFDQEEYVARGFGAGANLWARKDLVDRIGGFSERLAAYGGDDDEFGQRATASGAVLVYAPEVLLSHPPRTTVMDLVRKRFRLGYGLAAHRRTNDGPLGQTPRIFLRRSTMWPKAPKIQRLTASGYPLSKTQARKMRASAWALLQLPRAFGDLRGEWAYMRGKY